MMISITHHLTHVPEAFDAMGGCSSCDRPVNAGEPGWTWYSFRTEPGYFFAAGVGADHFYCPACSHERLEDSYDATGTDRAG
jgi:hypothetical protein